MFHRIRLKAGLRPVALAATLCALSLVHAGAHAANATDATVVWGMGSVKTSGSVTTVDQATAALRLDWRDLSVAKGESLVVKQGASTDVLINVVTGASPTNILGTVSAPGHVYVLNPNGVLIGKGAEVSVGSWVASTLGFQSFDQDAGALSLKRSGGAGQVVNEGTIRVSEGGTVALIGQQVRNAGSISAPAGRVLMLAGDQVVLTPDRDGLLSYALTRSTLQASVTNTGRISAADGGITLDARSLQQAVVNSSGILEAASVSEGPGGVIRLSALGAAGSSITVRGTVNAGAEGEATADLSEGGRLDFGPDALARRASEGPPMLDVVALDKVYDGTTDATVRFNLRSLSGTAGQPAVLDVTQAHFDDRFVQVDEPSFVHFQVKAVSGGEYLMPEQLAAFITPRELRVEADTKVYDGTTTANAHVLAGDLLDIDKDLVQVSISGARFTQADVNPDGAVAVTWTDARITGSGNAAASYKLATEGAGVITPRQLNVRAADKVADGTRNADLTLVTADVLERDLGNGRFDVTLGSGLFDSALASASPVGVSYRATVTGAAAANYWFSGRTSATISAPVVPPVQPPVVPPTTPPELPVVIGEAQRGGQSTPMGLNPVALFDPLSALPAPAAGEDNTDKAGTRRSDRDSPVRIIDGGVKLPTLLIVRASRAE